MKVMFRALDLFSVTQRMKKIVPICLGNLHLLLLDLRQPHLVVVCLEHQVLVVDLEQLVLLEHLIPAVYLEHLLLVAHLDQLLQAVHLEHLHLTSEVVVYLGQVQAHQLHLVCLFNNCLFL